MLKSQINNGEMKFFGRQKNLYLSVTKFKVDGQTTKCQ